MTIEQEKQQEIILTKAHNDYSKSLSSYAFFKVNNKAISEDLVQDTFMKTWTYLLRGGKVILMKAFLYHVLNNLIVDQYRKHKTTSLDVLLEKGFEPSEDNVKSFTDIIDGRSLTLLIKKLPKTYQKVMEMKYIKELSLKEMSIITGKSKNTLAVQAHRGLDKLKLLYKFA